ncbi:MAG: ATP-binding protein [bacterium]|nr:ATP-binding protein [bacterium]
MSGERTNIEQLISSSERIGTIGSPSSTSGLSLDILGTAVGKKLVGELAFFRFSQDGKPHYALGQITEVQLKNIWLEDPTMRSLARQRGQVNPVSGQQDTHLGDMTVSAVFSDDANRFEPSILGTVPATGTFIHLATDQILDRLLERYQDEIFYLGYVYGSTPKLPLWFKHFGTEPHGAGEAYHLGIFGKTGSGKSVLAKMILLAYARYSDMAIFVIDPQGEFSKDISGQLAMEGFPLHLGNILKSLNKNVIPISVINLVLDRWDLFEHILAQSDFFERLAIHTADKKMLAAEVLRENLERRHVRLSDLHTQEAFQTTWSILQEERVLKQIYSGAEYRNRLLDMINQTDSNDHYQTYWLPVCRLFQSNRQNAVTVDSLLRQAFTQQQTKPVIIVNVSREKARKDDFYWNDIIQALVIKRLLDGINLQAESNYQGNRSLNTLVIIDEAHRFAPREKPEQEELKQVGETLVRASKETRKYGLGWMFISQTLSSLHREIIGQLRTFFFGFGLALGTEFMSLKEIVGGDPNALKLYQSFRDPHSTFDIASRQYSFMTIGPVSPLSFAGTPLFLTAFNTPEEFLRINKLGL